jgi:predicted nucleic acid-binding protein
MLTTPEISEGPFTLVIDNTVLSNFAAIDRISLLERLYRDKACTTLMIVEEVQRGLEGGYKYSYSLNT